MATSKKALTYKEVWDTLSAVDITDLTKKNNGLTYLPWASAWKVLVEHYPEDVRYQWGELQQLNDGTCLVWCTLYIGELKRSMFLPVMTGYKNAAVANPDSRDVGDSMMRCLVKAAAMFGLGAHLYRGEDVPSQDTKAEKQEPAPDVLEDLPPGPGAVIKTKEAAEEMVVFLVESAETFATGSEAELIEFWTTNKPAIDVLDSHYPEEYAQLKAAFTKLRQRIKEKNA